MKTELEKLLLSHPLARRKVLGSMLGLGGLAGLTPSLMPNRLIGQDRDDEHFVVFIQLTGGIHWMLATDGRDLEALPMDDEETVMKLPLTKSVDIQDDQRFRIAGEANMKDSELSDEIAKKLRENSKASMEGGRFLLLPHEGDLADNYVKGTTSAGYDYILGPSGRHLVDVVDDMAVVRGVHMEANFHNRAWKELFSGHPDARGPHLAGMLAPELARKYGELPLDNLVLEGGEFVEMGERDLLPIRLTFESLGSLAGMRAIAGDVPLEVMRKSAQAYQNSRDLSAQQNRIFSDFLQSFDRGEQIRSRLGSLAGTIDNRDVSMDLPSQLDAAMTLFQSGLSRVITLALGKPNGRNKVDGFGLFDAHYGAYQVDPGNMGSINTMRHHVNVSATMLQLKQFIEKLKTTQFSGSKSMFDVTTVVVSSDYGRPSNIAGNEAFNGGAVGNGHWYPNNNYLLFGKGVKGGTWIGQNDAVTQVAHKVDRSGSEPVYAPMELGSFNEGEAIRPYMARDIVRTVAGITGLDGQFRNYYQDGYFSRAWKLDELIERS